MAIKINFYRFSKKENSTARPSGTGTELDCTLKDSSSIFFPVIKLNMGAASAPSFNYCHIPNFNRWYFITNWEWDRGLWYASLQVDVLATYRTEIGSSSLYALRASNNYDGTIVDNLYPTKVGCTFAKSDDWTISGAGGFAASYIMGVVSKDPDFGSIKYYALNSSNLGTIIDELLDDTIKDGVNGFSAADASIALQKSLIDPLQYIKSCIYIPMTLTEINSALSTAAAPVTIFNWDLTATARSVRPPTPVIRVTHDFTIPKHPQTVSRGNFVNQSPYTMLWLYAPPFGVVDIDTTAFANNSVITVEIDIDLPTGLGILKIKRGDEIINRLEANIGVPIQLSQIIKDYLGAASAVLGGIGSVISGIAGGPAGIASGVIGAANGVGNAIQSLMPKSQTIGSGGSYAQVRGGWSLQAQFFTIADDDIAHNGRPLCQMVTPSNGYYLIQDGDIAIDGTKEEAAELKRYLESGFYYE